MSRNEDNRKRTINKCRTDKDCRDGFICDVRRQQCIEDGVDQEIEIFGCTSPSATNYNQMQP